MLRSFTLKRGNTVHVGLVMDGHGMLGELAAQTAGASIADYIETQLTRKLNVRSIRDVPARKMKEVVNAAFQKAHDDVIALYLQPPKEYNFPAPGFAAPGMRPHAVFNLDSMEGGVLVYSSPMTGFRLVEFGTTASLAIVENGYIVVAHVGDSDVIVGSMDADGFVTSNEMTKPHSAFSTSERFRIAELLSADDDNDMVDLVNMRDDGYLEVPNLGGLPSSVALGMTRAIGHKHLEEYGVIARPDIRFYETSDDDLLLVLATDGVWDAMHPRDAAVYLLQKVLMDGEAMEAAVKDLCDSCVAMQERALGLADNTSAVVLRIGTRAGPSDRRDGPGAVRVAASGRRQPRHADEFII